MPATAHAALTVLVYYLPMGHRQNAAAELLKALAAYCKAEKIPLPAWFEEVQDLLR